MSETTTTTIKSFDQADLEQLKKLAELYTQAKLLILYSEEIDPSARSNIQVIKELRDALDHLMRVVAARLGDTVPAGAGEQNYCFKNLDKAIGHVYRAAFDALDGTVLSLREKIVEILKNYPQTVITKVIPDYWQLRTSLETLTRNIASHRAAKDVAGNVGETLNLYVSDAEEIKTFYNRIINCGESLDECLRVHEEEEKSEHRKHIKGHIVGGLGYTILGGIGMLILSAFGCNPMEAAKRIGKGTEGSYASPAEKSPSPPVLSPNPEDKKASAKK
ncbi:MAG: hypothetical protein WBK19_01765 [Azonexus sp.]